jgi:hypothetical protein
MNPPDHVTRSPESAERAVPHRKAAAPAQDAPQPRDGALAGMANWAAPALIVITPYVGYLGYHDYPLGRLDSVAAIALLAGAGLALSCLIALRPLVLRPAVIALLLVLFLDLRFTLQQKEFVILWLASLSEGPDRLLRLAAVPVPFLALGMVTWLLRRHIGTIVTVVFGIMLLGALVLPAEKIRYGETIVNKSPAADPALPPVVHLVLDEQIGVEGLPADVAGGMEVRRELTALYEGYGFTVFGRAFSHYVNTMSSLANLMNGTANPLLYTNLTPSNVGFRLQDSRWFQDLSERGYRIRVYQSSYLDFCSVPRVSIDYCYTYPADSIRSTLDFELGLVQRLRLAFAGHWHHSLIYRFVGVVYRVALAPFLARQGIEAPTRLPLKPRLSALPSLPVIDRISEDLLAAPGGTAVFAHLLAPHNAYVFDPDCRLRTDLGTWSHGFDPTAPGSSDLTPRTRTTSYIRYFKQVQCTHRRIAALLQAMDKAGILDRATVVIHGDHGSRISLSGSINKKAGQMSDLDLIDNYSTFFAIRLPGQDGGYERRIRSVQDVFTDLVLRRPLAEPHRNVFIFPRHGQSGQPLDTRRMPDFGDESRPSQ